MIKTLCRTQRRIRLQRQKLSHDSAMPPKTKTVAPKTQQCAQLRCRLRTREQVLQHDWRMFQKSSESSAWNGENEVSNNILEGGSQPRSMPR